MEIYIVNPDTGKLVTIDDWRKEEDPTRAELIAIKREGLKTLLLAKDFVDGDKRFTFADAQKAAAQFVLEDDPFGDKLAFRCPTRKECIDIYDARFSGLDDARALLGGQSLKALFWTCDKDSDPEYTATTAWYFSGTTGTLSYSSVSTAPRCQAVTLSDLD